MNNLDKNYQNLLQDILDNGVEKQTRNGKVLSVFGRTIRHNMSEGFPLLTSKKMAFKSIVVELLWFLKGRSDLRYLLEHNCNIWVGDALKAFHKHEMEVFKKLRERYPNRRYKFSITSEEEFIEKIKTDDKFAKEWGDLGKIYGYQWRKWNDEIDQIQNLINDLKTNPDSRRLIVNAWAVDDLSEMVLPPCHYGFQVYTRELSVGERYDILNKMPSVRKRTINIGNSDPLEINKIPKRAISLMWQQRSVDTFLGLPFNIASYALLLRIIATEVNMIPDELIGSLGDVHLYSNHIEQAKEQIGRFSYELPNVSFLDEYHHLNDKELVGDISFIQKVEEFRPDFFLIVDYQSHPAIKAPLSN